MQPSERGMLTCSKYSPAAAATAALLSFCLLLSMQFFGDPNLWRAFRHGAGKAEGEATHLHGAVTAFGAEEAGASHLHLAGGADVSAASLPRHGGAVAASDAAMKGNATAGPAPAVLEVLAGTEVVFTRVPNPKAVLLLFHGCSHSARDWGSNSSTCPDCLGLPEEAAIVRTARAFSYVPVAFSSSDRESRCWDAQWLDKSRDIPAVREAFGNLSAREGWDKLPRYALGASSGASMVLFLALRMPLDGIVPQIMSLPPHMLETKPEDLAAAPGKTWTYPPTYFMHMDLDRATVQRVTADINVLKTKQGAWVTEKIIRPRPITETLFSERVEGISLATSVAMHKALKDADILNATDFLRQDPRQTLLKWQSALASVPGLAGVSLEPEMSPVFEELNLAWARHELISDGLNEVLEWLDARRRDGSAKLMAAVKPRRQLHLRGSPPEGAMLLLDYVH